MQALLTIDVQGDYFTECTACRESCEYVGNWLSMDITNEYERMPDIGCMGRLGFFLMKCQGGKSYDSFDWR